MFESLALYQLLANEAIIILLQSLEFSNIFYESHKYRISTRIMIWFIGDFQESFLCMYTDNTSLLIKLITFCLVYYRLTVLSISLFLI